MTGELATLPSSEETYRADVNFVADLFEIETIYTQHGDITTSGSIKSAQRTSDAIMPSSIVLMESAKFIDDEQVNNGSKAYLLDMAASVGLALLIEGSRSPKYIVTKQKFLHYLSKLQKTKQDMTIIWQAVVISQLIQKDCAVFAADYDNRIQRPDPEEASRLVTQLDSKGEFDPKFIVDKSIGKLFRKAISAQLEYFDAHHEREWAAAVNGTTLLANLFKFAPSGMQNMARSISHPKKYKAYYIWGAGHTDSLDAQLADNGYTLASTILVDDSEATQYRLPVDNETDIRRAAISGALAFVLRIAVNLSDAANQVPERKSRLINEIAELQLTEEDVVRIFVRTIHSIRDILDTISQKPFILDTGARRRWTSKMNGNTQNLRTILGDAGLNPNVYLQSAYAKNRPRKIRKSDISTDCNFPGVLISR